ncbi:MAG TPA: dTDP-glucose 4,6-dehydratase [Eubacteriales bacterium]|nr:dTDP-glucose 4,6-dehydratase [Eubacteriales bacterium]
MKILVTGGAGFIGCNFIDYELEKHGEDEIVCLDALTYAGYMGNLNAYIGLPNFRFVKGRIEDAELVDRLFAEEGFDFVANFAAETHVDRSLIDPAGFLTTNVIGTQVLLDAARRYGVSRFHQVGTDEVYGDLPLDRPDLRFVETLALKPSSPYSASKASADLLALAYHRSFGLAVTVSRCSNNYGPCQFPEKLIPLMITRALRDEPLPVYGVGANVRDWLYVRDHCAAIDLIMRKAAVGSVYNIGGDEEHNNLNVVRTILRLLDKPETLISFVTDRPGHDLRYAMDADKLKTELGWRPSVNFEEGMKHTVEWYLANKEWLANVMNADYRQSCERIYGEKKVR